MRSLKLWFLALMLLCVAGSSLAGSREAFLDGVTYSRNSVCKVVTADTLWFTKTLAAAYNSGAAAVAADWFAPSSIPWYADGNGVINTVTAPVTRALMYSRVPFTYQAWAQGTSTGAFAVTVDTVGVISRGAGTTIGDEFPCWEIVTFPDTLVIAEAGADSVVVDLGYELMLLDDK